MSYRVFARKYRPQRFDEVVGQEHITRTLANAIRDERVAQAYMFVGPRGIGKTSTARILAKALNCMKGPTPEPCGVCDACIEIAEGRSLDVIEIDGASNNGVDNIRDLREAAAYAPARGPFKIYLIDEVHMLSSGAFNALLKTLEEPPEHVKFIFATTEAQKVPATITSRCQRFDLRRIPAPAIAAHLGAIAAKEKITLEPAAAEAIARAAEGGLRDAESMLDQAVAFCSDTSTRGGGAGSHGGGAITRDGVMEIFGFTPHESMSALVERILERDARGALDIVAALADSGKDLSRLMGDLTAHLRDLLVQGVASDSPARRDGLLALLDHFADAESRMRWAADKKLQFDVALIKAVHLLGQASLDDVIARLAALQADAPPPGGGGHAPTPVAPAQPGPAAPRQEVSLERSTVDASVAWEEVAAEMRKTLVNRWLGDAVFASFRDGLLTLQLPPSCAVDPESVVALRARSEVENKLAGLLGRKVAVVVELGAGGEAPLELHEAPPAPEDPAPAEPEDPMKAFLDDPLIRRALDQFKAELVTAV